MSKSTQIRREFIEFFRQREHTVVPSAPVIPVGDNTLLFTNAGMNQFKDVFLEQGSRPYTRAVDTQKCIRVSGKHNDLEVVGRSHSHHTFFEMLGNWSFGDYYKREAIRWAWELLTKVWSIDPNHLYATIFEGSEEAPRDEEAFQAWREETSLPPERISAHSRKDNFWEMGDVGPCGPCSEIHYDLGEAFCQKRGVSGHVCRVNGDCGRLVELWNLVFIQYRRDEAGALHPLPRRHVDTGAGFERVVRLLEGVNSNYDTSLFQPIIGEVARISGVAYSPGETGVPHRIAADHIRMLAFALADGALPSNEGRGYVLRRILRRAARYGREIGIETPYLYRLVEPLTTVMGEAFPELKERHRHIVGVIKAEEESFSRTLGRGLELFGGLVETAQIQGASVIPGAEAFKLYDTFGFPIDLTRLMAEERNLTIDEAEFQRLMEAQRERARGEGKFAVSEGEYSDGLSCEFTGYDLSEHAAKVLLIHPSKGGVEIILDRTPFYAESGGQEADWGDITTGAGRLTVTDVVKKGDLIIHRGQWSGGEMPQPGEEVWARIDEDRRQQIRYNHTATHLLHTALRKHLGGHASQAGSLVAPDRMRFDFTHFEKITPETLAAVEREVNEAIRADYPVSTTVKSYQEAIEGGVIALFSEKYGEVVRIVQIGEDDAPYSRELCGGTHVSRTGQIGLFRITSEGAVSAGVRRIEVLTGEAAYQSTVAERETIEKMVDLMGSHGSDPTEKLAKILDEKKALEKERQELLLSWAASQAESMLAEAPVVKGVKAAARAFEGLDIDRLKMIGDALRERDPGATGLIAGTVSGGAGQLCCVVGDRLLAETKLKAGDLVGKAAKLAGGGGGGRPHMATAGTRTPEKLPEALAAFAGLVEAGM